jgi:phosphodiesterase/alkaline phosphatase D-like protein
MDILRRTAPPVGLFGRRGFLTGAGAALLHATLAGRTLSQSASAQGLGDYPFTLGVASGDPAPDGIVLWTRLAPKPLEGGGMPAHPIAVEWRIATDERMHDILQRGAVLAVPELGHSVHVEVDGLQSARWYWYQFKVGSEYSPIGRTRTAPASGSTEDLRFAFVSCQHYANGFYYAHRHLSREDLHFAVHLGDYIYEGPSTSPIQRAHLPAHEITSGVIDGELERPGQPGAVAPNDTNADPLVRNFGGEKWDGYPIDRQKVLDFIAGRNLVNTVVITGDVHQNFVRNVPPDYIRLDAQPIATEFIGTSISTGGDRTLTTVFGGNANNPHLRFQNNHHGYVRCSVSPDGWRADYRVIPSVVQADDGGIGTVASFVVEKGQAGAVLA